MPGETAVTAATTPLNPDSSDTPAKPRERRWAPKVRTGCQTCRARRVKCDETKPECKRCIAGRFVCQGYPRDPSLPEPAAPAVTFWSRLTPRLAPSGVTPTPGGLQLSHYFRTQVIQTCFDEFGRDLWLRHFPQAAQHDAAVWHGCNAIASCWQLRAMDPTNTIKGAVDKVRQDGMRQYSSMLSELVEVAHRPHLTATDKTTILAVNFLVAIYLNSTGQLAEFQVILANTANLFRRWQPWHYDAAGAIPSTSILLLFLKLERVKENCNLVTCQKPWLWNDALLSLQKRPLRSCTDATLELELMYMGLQSIFPTFFNVWTDSDATRVADASLAALGQIFSSWTERFNRFLASGLVRSEDRGPLSAIELRRIAIDVMLKVDVSCLETCWDGFDDDFAKALLVAERLQSDTTLPPFAPTVLQLLHWMAKTCRNPRLRRRMVAVSESQLQKFPPARQAPAKIKRSPMAVINAVLAHEETAWSQLRAGQSPHECGCTATLGCVDGEYICNNHRVTQIFLKSRGNPQGSELTLQTVGDVLSSQPGQLMYVRSLVWG